MKNKKILIIGVSAFILMVMAVIVGLMIYNKTSNNSSVRGGTNPEYDKCMKEAEENDRIIDDVDKEIEKCTRDYIKAQGYNDDLWCVGTNNNDPICNQEKYDENGNNIGRYNAEVYGSNGCEEQRETLMKEKGYKEDSIEWRCIELLNK